MRPVNKIVWLTPGFPADEQDLTCTTYLQDLALAYRRVRPAVQLEIIAFQYPFREGAYLWNGIKVHSAGGRNKKYLNRLLTWRKVLDKLRRIHCESPIDIVHSFWLTECTFVGQRFCRKHSIPHVASILGQDTLPRNNYFSRIDFSRIEVTSVSGKLAEDFKQFTGRSVKAIIPFGLDTGKLGTTQAKREIDIMGAGGLTPLKNYSLFIDIVRELKKDFPEIRACIAGKGEEFGMLRKKIEKLGLDRNVELKGELPPASVFEWMCKSKIFLHTSSYEGQSLVMMEAMYAGLPVVCFAGHAYREKKMHVCRSREEMVSALRKLLSQPADHTPVLAKTSEQSAADYFSVYGE